MVNQKCRICHQSKNGSEYDTDRQGLLRKGCRACLARQRELQRVRQERIRASIASHIIIPENHPVAVQEPGRVEASPRAYIINSTRWKPLDFSRMDILCSSCHAKHWISERIIQYEKQNPKFELCCKHEDDVIPKLLPWPDAMQTLMSGESARSRQFHNDIRLYNSAFAFTSVRYNMDNREYTRGGGVMNFQTCGELYHLQGPLIAPGSIDARYSQIYLYDPGFGANLRADRFPTLDREYIEILTETLYRCSPWITIYKTAAERLREQEADGEHFRIILNPQLQLLTESGADLRRANLPVANEVAMIIPEEYGEAGFRDLVLAKRNIKGDPGEQSDFSRIDPNHAAYLPLHYTLMFPAGELGWHSAMELANSTGIRQRLRLPQRTFYRFRLHPRSDEPTNIFQCGKLFQQFVVDAWAICDQSKLLWLRTHQNNFRADLYNGLMDVLIRENHVVDIVAIGKKVILPSSYLGGDRFMQQLYQDSMAIVRHFGKPTFFITFTANPKWLEITRELGPGEATTDRPDLVARVFHMKQQELLRQIKKDHIFGRYRGCVWTIEYQKRGLPHMHLLLFIETAPSFLTAETIDSIISAELPEELTEDGIRLGQIVKTSMVHTACVSRKRNALCLKQSRNGQQPTCSKSYPRAFQPTTIVHENGYPLYRRREDSRAFEIPVHGAPIGTTVRIDNQYVVPYSPYLTLMFDAHINVEICGSVRAVKYIHKYIYKGSDQATVQINSEKDEISRYLNGRYIGPTEAIWRLFEYKVHEEQPAVKHLALHLPGHQPVYYSETLDLAELQTRVENSCTTLTAFFDNNAKADDGREYLYQEFPEHYRYIANKGWQKRVRDSSFAIGRIYSASPFMGEKYYLRLLLTIVRGSKSYEDLRTVLDTTYSTFKGACEALGLLENDAEWISMFTEASLFASGYALRQLFSIVLSQTTISNPPAVWHKFKDIFCDDLPYKMTSGQVYIPADAMEHDLLYLDYGLYLLQDLLSEHNRTLAEFDLPAAKYIWTRMQHERNPNPLIQEELNYQIPDESATYERMRECLNIEQKVALEAILEGVENKTYKESPACFFLHGPAGTGKTFLYKVICNKLRSEGKVVIGVASSGIAAQLLPGGRTAHSRFKIPLSNDTNSNCNITKNSELAQLIRNTSLIIWDEVPMQHRACFEAVNRTLNDICSAPEGSYFGRIPIVLGGDFSQILPVVRHGGMTATIRACLQNTGIWHHLHILHLKQNMRLIEGNLNTSFQLFLSKIVHDTAYYGQLSLPDYLCRTTSVKDFCLRIYPSTLLHNAVNNANAFKERSILAYRNDTVDEFNNHLIMEMPGQLHELYAMNSVDMSEEAAIAEPFANEYLQTINIASLPPANLKLKIGAAVILLRNLSPLEGLCNGTRLRILGISWNCLKVAFLGGDRDGHIRLLPRIKLSSGIEDLPFILIRKQFPIRLSFAMTVNKAQGQSLHNVGIDLRSPAFTHGQLYVALSRATSVTGLALLMPESTPTTTTNVVFPSVLLE